MKKLFLWSIAILLSGMVLLLNPMDVKAENYYWAEAQETAEQKAERGLISEEESRAFDLQRRRNALQYQLREAVDAENYEEAARLRDELRALPQN